HVVAAVRADLQVRQQVAVENHLLAGRALMPQVLRRLAAREQRADLRADIVGKPVHAGTRAPRTPSASARTCSSTRATSSGLPRLAAIVLHSAEPTTAASATRTASAACTGVRTPNPTAIGRSVTRRMRGIASPRCSAVVLRVPVMPVMLT